MYYPKLTTDIVGWCLVTIIVGVALVLRELNPDTQLGYSKFTKSKTPLHQKKIPSKLGMLLIYVPSLMEVLFVHRYSGQSVLQHVLIISSSYAGFSISQLYFTSLVPTHLINKTEINLGILLFFIGEGINYYHHIILSNLRNEGSKEYKIPTDGLFQYIWCPHYLGEIISFISMTLLSQHMVVLMLQISSAAYLAVRAYNTRLWYHQKFDSVPKKACVLPGIF
ncbi:unnamed protein product [Cunninghamella blakesleeana]